MKLKISLCLLVVLASCGKEPEKKQSNGNSNNIAVNNIATNNIATNNIGTNNVATNNTSPNNVSQACTFDADCRGGEACELQQCVAVCATSADCAASEWCAPGFTTELNVCQQEPLNAMTNNSTNNGTNNPPVNPLYVAMIQSTTSDVSSCEEVVDPGPDIFGVALEDQSGVVLGWAEVIWDEITLENNDHVDSSILDGSAPALAADNCPDMFDGSVVALGCAPDPAFLLIDFLDSAGQPIALDASADQVIRVYEYGAQCSTGGITDTYDLSICTNTVGARGGDASSCTITLLIDGAGEQAVSVGGF